MVPDQFALGCAGCGRQHLVDPGSCAVVTPPAGSGGGSWLSWACPGGCGPRAALLSSMTAGHKLKVWELVSVQVVLSRRPVVRGRMVLDDVIDLDRDLARLFP